MAQQQGKVTWCALRLPKHYDVCTFIRQRQCYQSRVRKRRRQREQRRNRLFGTADAICRRKQSAESAPNASFISNHFAWLFAALA
jgi:hypothetical protein